MMFGVFHSEMNLIRLKAFRVLLQKCKVYKDEKYKVLSNAKQQPQCFAPIENRYKKNPTHLLIGAKIFESSHHQYLL